MIVGKIDKLVIESESRLFEQPPITHVQVAMITSTITADEIVQLGERICLVPVCARCQGNGHVIYREDYVRRCSTCKGKGYL